MTSRVLEQRGIESEQVFKALGSETRLKMLALLADREMNINELGHALGIMPPTVSRHMQLLEQAGLVSSEYMPGTQGMQKRCRLVYDRLTFDLKSLEEQRDMIETVEMPLGLFTSVHALPTCGLANTERLVGMVDEPYSFFHPDRVTAGILWLANGFIEYTFPNMLPASAEIRRIDIAMEVCSEAPGMNADYPSDITVWINGVELGAWTSPGEFLDQVGALNRDWWVKTGWQQYGLWKVWSVDQEGAFVDGVKVSPVTLADVPIATRQPMTVRIGIKPDSAHVGGITLFGRGFGNYDQDLLLRVHYAPREVKL